MALFEVPNRVVYCSDCHDLCTLHTNRSSGRPEYCPKSGKKCEWRDE